MSPTDRRYVPYLAPDPDALMRAFVQQPVFAQPPSEARDIRERMIHGIEQSRAEFIAVRSARAKLRRAVLLAVAACVPFGIFGVVWASHGRPVHAAGIVEVVPLVGTAAVSHDGVDRILTTSTPAWLDSRDELRTGPAAFARASLPTGVVVDIGSSAQVRFDPGGGQQVPLRDRIELVAGKVHVRVPKLVAGDEVNVLAAGVSIVVHGTEFSVERVTPNQPGAPGLTKVTVTEGVVTAYTAADKQELRAGAVLVLMAPSEPADPAVVSPPPAPSQATPTQATSASPAAVLSSPAVGASTLAAENALLADAMRLRRGGEGQRALARLRELLERYPRSPLAETARVERLRALDDLGATTELRREAERYLADYPQGFARPEASRILASSSGSRR